MSSSSSARAGACSAEALVAATRKRLQTLGRRSSWTRSATSPSCAVPRRIAETAENRIRNLKDLIATLDGAEPAAQPPFDRLQSFLEQITLDTDREEEEDEAPGDAVTLITMHSCKGLEFPHVYIVGLEDGLLPHSRSKVEGTLDEERRLFYVAITRAMQTLTISHCGGRKKYGQRSCPAILRRSSRNCRPNSSSTPTRRQTARGSRIRQEHVRRRCAPRWSKCGHTLTILAPCPIDTSLPSAHDRPMNELIYPRSPRETMCGWMYLPRFVDKIRLHLAGKLHADYQPNFCKGFDDLWLKTAGVDATRFIEVVRNSITDGEVCDWVLKNVRQPDSVKTAHRDRMLANPKPDDAEMQARLAKRKQDAGLAHRDDVRTFVDFIDADEKRI